MNNSLLTNDLQPQEMIENLISFCEKLLELANDIGVNIAELSADHIALRINDESIAKLAHEAWLDYGQQISSAYINGRPIIVIQFHQPLKIANWKVECLELPYPAEGKIYPQQGWEHMEFIIPSEQVTAENYLADIRKQCASLDAVWDSLAEKGIKTKLSSPKGEGERLANPTVAFKRDGVCIKIHPHTLKKVVESEL